MNLFKYNKQKLIWDFLPQRPSNVDFGVTDGKSIEDYLVPAVSVMPEWFKSLKQTKDYLKKYPNVRTCPSFVDLFKDSYAFIAPCDFEISISAKSMNMVQTEEGWIQIASHTATPNGNQMGDMWDKNLHNIKIMTGLQIGTNKGHFNFMYLPAYYHDPRTNLFAPPGISTVTEDNPLDLNLNVFVDTSNIKGEDIKTIKIKNGTVLAYLYLPEGMIKAEKGKLNKKLRKSFLGDYRRLNKEYFDKKSKCPFHF